MFSPRKVLATIVEHAGMIPGDKEPTNIMKDLNPQLVIPETAAEEMNNWRIGERGDDVDLVDGVPAALIGPLDGPDHPGLIDQHFFIPFI